MLAISGLAHAMLHVIVRPLGAVVAENTALENAVVENTVVETLIADGITESKKKKKQKKVKIGKKSKGCC